MQENKMKILRKSFFSSLHKRTITIHFGVLCMEDGQVWYNNGEWMMTGFLISVLMTCLLLWFFISLLHATGEIHRRSVRFLQNKHTRGEQRWSYSASAGGRRYYCTWFCPVALDGVWSAAGLLALCHKHRSNTWAADTGLRSRAS